jgi:hypothetical protein
MRKGLLLLRRLALLLTVSLLAIMTSALVVALVGRFASKEVGVLNHWLRQGFAWIGAEDVPWVFSWSWTTVFTIISGVPFAAGLHFGYALGNSDYRRDCTRAWLLLLPLSCVISVGLLRFVDPLVAHLHLHPTLTAISSGIYYGVPIVIIQYLALRVVSQHQSRRITDS